jgi:crossover junction endodeoxyribonuclease RuvC
VKKSVSGLGAASKEQVRFMVCKILNLNIKTLPKQTDISDAIAVALCHHNKMLGGGGSKKKTSASWKDYVAKNPSKVRRQ